MGLVTRNSITVVFCFDCRPYNQSDTAFSVNSAVPVVLIYLAADSVSRKVISEGTQAGEQRSTSNAASAIYAGCMHLSWLNMPSVIGVATAAGWIATTLTLSNLMACTRHSTIRTAMSSEQICYMLCVALSAVRVQPFWQIFGHPETAKCPSLVKRCT